MRQLRFASGSIYHICNRGVEKRNIFEDDKDRFRFVYTLPIVNGGRRISNIGRDFEILKEALLPSGSPLVEILAFVLMPNHFHLLLRQLAESGVSKFMQRFGTAYTNYFNIKYERSGALFQGTFKAIEVTGDEQLYHLFFYIHAANPTDIICPDWRECGIPDYRQVVSFVNAYTWSSLSDYLGQKRFPGVTQREFLTDFIGGRARMASELETWLRAREKNLALIGKVSLEP